MLPASPTYVVLDGIEELERAFAGLLDVDVGVAEPRVRHQEGGQREGHLVGIEPLCRRALALLVLRLADGDQGDAQAVLVEVRLRPLTSKSEASRILWMSAWLHGESCEDDPQRLFAAVDLERNGLAVLGLDLALGQGRADQALDAGVVDLQASRNRGSSGRGPRRARARRRRDSRVHRRRHRGSGRSPAACASDRAACLRSRRARPGRRPARARRGAGRISRGAERRVDVVAIFLVEVESPERLERAVAGPVEARDAALETGRADRRDSAES